MQRSNSKSQPSVGAKKTACVKRIIFSETDSCRFDVVLWDAVNGDYVMNDFHFKTEDQARAASSRIYGLSKEQSVYHLRNSVCYASEETTRN